jgi:Domain of unknown function (DUF4267)
MSGSRPSPLQGWIIGIALVGGALLAIIGIRYLVVPESAAFTFGVADKVLGHELHYIIGLRNVWLGLLAIVFAILREWRALTLWFGLGSVVCFADAGIAASSSGRLPQVAFHIGAGVICLALTFLIPRVTRRES